MKIICSEFKIDLKGGEIIPTLDVSNYSTSTESFSSALFSTGISARQIGLLIYAFSDRRGVTCHSHASTVQHLVGARNAKAFNVSLGCSSAHLSLIVAVSLSKVFNVRNCAVASDDRIKNYINENDPNHKSLLRFRNGGSTILLSSHKPGFRLLYTDMKNVSRFHDNLFLPDEDSKYKTHSTEEEEGALARVYKNMYRYMFEKLISRLSQADQSRVTSVIINQSSKSVIDEIAASGRIRSEIFVRNYDKYGHVGSSDIAIGINNVISANPKNGDIILILTSSVGFAWVGSIWTWDESIDSL